MPGPILRPAVPRQILYFDKPMYDPPTSRPPYHIRPESQQPPILSLTPPPRPIRSRSHSPTEASQELAFTHMPSLTAFGGRGSSENASRISVMSVEDDSREQGRVDHRSGSESRSRAGSRPLTASSSRTFGDTSSDRVSSCNTAG